MYTKHERDLRDEVEILIEKLRMINKLKNLRIGKELAIKLKRYIKKWTS